MRNTSLSLLLLMSFALLGCGEKPAPGRQAAAESPAASAPAAPIVDPATAGSVAGVVNLTGTPPKVQTIDMSQDPACVMGPNAGVTHTSEAFVVKSGKLGNVFVYVKEGLPGGKYPAPSTPLVIDQQGCKYVPHVAGAVVGQTVRFLNSDPTMHNVHPDAQANSPWNITQTPKGEPIEKSFSKPELMMKVSCNQHPWMRMYLNVVEHPYFAVSDADGKFEIKGLPAGEYVLAAVHERLGEKLVKVKVEAKGEAGVAFSF